MQRQLDDLETLYDMLLETEDSLIVRSNMLTAQWDLLLAQLN